MSRSKPQQHGRRPQLPFSMRQELGIPKQRHQRTQVSERKQRRKEARRDPGGYSNKRQKISHHTETVNDLKDGLDISDEPSDLLEEAEESEQDNPSAYHEQTSHASTTRSRKSTKQTSPVSSLPESEAYETDEEDEDILSRGSREYSPEVVLDASSRTFQERQARDDAEILALEKKLGMKNKKEKFFDDGFDSLLEDLDDAVQTKSRKQEADEWLKMKRTKAAMKNNQKSVEVDEVSADEVHDSEFASGGDDDFAGFDDDDEDQEDSEETEDNRDFNPQRASPTSKPHRENPYVAPPTVASSAKYIPPSRRKLPETDGEVLQKLRKQAQGSLNKLSEANMISIVDEFGKFYQLYPRQDVTQTISDLVLSAFAIPTALNNTFIILHAAFITGLYKLHGADFGAEVICRLVETFDKFHHSSVGKESLNLTSLLANLFTFNLITSTLIYDHIRLLLGRFGSSASSSEDSAEHLLRIIRDCGPQLRSDDPGALKGIVVMMNDASAKMAADGSKVNARTRVMMDTIIDLKNNKIRHNTSAAGVTGEHITRMRKALGSLSNRQLRGTEPLGLSRTDILESDKKGKWWLIGASWKGRSETQSGENPMPISHKMDSTVADTSTTIDVRALAASYNLTTPLRLSVFAALITAHSPPDALHRLTKLRLTRRQEVEVPRVLLTLCRAEPSFNPYYAALARQLLRERRYRMPFSIALWKFFGEMGEQTDEDGDEDDGSWDKRAEKVKVNEIANIARLYARLVAKLCLQPDILKTLNIGLLGEKATMWLEVFFIALLAQNKLDNEAIVRIFGTCEESLSKGIAWFLDTHVKRSDLLVDSEEKKKVRRGCRLVESTFAAAMEEDLED